MTGTEVVLLLEQALSPVPGGTGRYSLELAQGLRRTAAADDRVRFMTAWHRDLGPARVPGAAGPSRLPLPRRPLIAAWERGLGPAPRRGDIIHAPTLLVPPAHGKRLVVTIHDTVPWSAPETLTARGLRFHRGMAERAARHADAIVVPTQAVAEELVSAVPAIAAARVHALGEGVADVLTREPDPAFADEVRRRLQLPQTFLLSVATLEPRKGLDLAISALAAVPDRSVPLLVVGQPGWGGLDLAALAAQAGLAPDRVRVLGRLPDAELAVVLRAATMLLAPSRAEGFGLPVLEAMAVGTPVICSDVPAMVEVAGGAARVVARGDVEELAAAIAELLDDQTERSRLSALGLDRAVDYSWDRVAARAWQLYHSLD